VPAVVREAQFGSVIARGSGRVQHAVEATDAIERLASDLGRHARAARAIAEEYFDSDKVLNRLIDEARKA
jgi:hypothetical protein